MSKVLSNSKAQGTLPTGGADGNYLRKSGSTNFVTVWSSVTLPNSATTGDILSVSASNVYSNIAAVASGSLLSSAGTGTLSVWSASPTLTTSLTVPTLIGGTGTTSTLTYKTTTGTGATGADHIFQVGTNGGTEAMRILNSGRITIGSATANTLLNIKGNHVSNYGLVDIDGTGSTNAYLGLNGPNPGQTGIFFKSVGTAIWYIYNEAATSRLTFFSNAGGLEAMGISSTGKVAIGSQTPTANLHIKAGTATSSTAPLKFTTGTNLTTAEAGAMEYTDPLLYFTPTGTVRGVVSVAKSSRATAQIAANASVFTYTLPATDGSFKVSANVLVTTSSAENFSVTCSYTDEGNTARVQTIPFVLLAGTVAGAIAFANGAVPYEGVVFRIRCKASTSITIATTGTFTGSTYNVEAGITQVN